MRRAMLWCLLALDLVLLLFVQSLLATALLPRRGNLGWTFLWLVVASVIWLIPQAIADFALRMHLILVVIALANWVVTACALLVFSAVAKSTPAAPLQAAAIDGCSFAGFYRHIGMPLTKPTLLPLALIAALLLALTPTCLVLGVNTVADFVGLAGVSLLSAIPLIILFFLRPRQR